jgi:type II secretion system protein N
MAQSKKETIYWSAVVLYGIILAGTLLYLRFPSDQFRQFCCNFVQEMIPGVSCSIGSIGYRFPEKLLFKDIQLSDGTVGGTLFFEDQHFVLKPAWRNPGREFGVESSAFGGQHSLRLKSSAQTGTIELLDLKIENLDLTRLAYLGRKLDRNVSGNLSASGSAIFTRSGLELVTASGEMRIKDGAFTLHRPILELDTMVLDTGSCKFTLQDKLLTITEGTIGNTKLNAVFTGEIQLVESLLAAEISFQGEFSPLPPLYQENRQLQAIVTRMQRQSNTKELPFTVGGTVGRPTFVFE